jgi:hypothetical protein
MIQPAEDHLVVFTAVPPSEDRPGSAYREEQSQYRAILRGFQADALIQQGQYGAAKNMIAPAPNNSQAFSALLNFIEACLGDSNEIEKQKNKLLQNKSLKDYEDFIKDFPNQTALKDNPLAFDKHSQCFTLPGVIRRLEVAEFRRQLGQWGLFVLNAHQFIELAIDAIAKDELFAFEELKEILQAKKTKSFNNYYKEPLDQKFEHLLNEMQLAGKSPLDWLADKYPEIAALKEGMPEANPLKFGLAVQLLIGKASNNEARRQFLSTIEPYVARHVLNYLPDQYQPSSPPPCTNNRDLTMMRNRYAHEGQLPGRANIEERLPGFLEAAANWPSVWGIPNENFFLRTNRVLLKELRGS